MGVEPEENIGYWYNFTTGNMDARLVGTPITDEEARQHIDQDETVQALYSLYRDMGEEPEVAMRHVLHKVIEIHDETFRR